MGDHDLLRDSEAEPVSDGILAILPTEERAEDGFEVARGDAGPLVTDGVPCPYYDDKCKTRKNLPRIQHSPFSTSCPQSAGLAGKTDALLTESAWLSNGGSGRDRSVESIEANVCSVFFAVTFQQAEVC